MRENKIVLSLSVCYRKKKQVKCCTGGHEESVIMGVYFSHFFMCFATWLAVVCNGRVSVMASARVDCMLLFLHAKFLETIGKQEKL